MFDVFGDGNNPIARYPHLFSLVLNMSPSVKGVVSNITIGVMVGRTERALSKKYGVIDVVSVKETSVTPF